MSRAKCWFDSYIRDRHETVVVGEDVCVVRKIPLVMAILAFAGCSAEQGSGALASMMRPEMLSGAGAAFRGASYGGGGISKMSSLMGSVLQSLSAEQQRQRQQSLQEAAWAPVGRSVSWTSGVSEGNALPGRGTSRSAPAATRQTHATYTNKGTATNDRGQQCSKIQETITLPDGKAGTSEQLVCPS